MELAADKYMRDTPFPAELRKLGAARPFGPIGGDHNVSLVHYLWDPLVIRLALAAEISQMLNHAALRRERKQLRERLYQGVANVLIKQKL